MSAEVARGSVAARDEQHGGTKMLCFVMEHGAYRAKQVRLLYS